MSEKIYSFVNAAEAQPSNPLDKDAILAALASIDEEHNIWDYVDLCSKLINNINLWRDLLNCSSNRQRCKQLLDSMDDEQLMHFSNIVTAIQQVDSQDDLQQLINSTWSLKSPTSASFQKAIDLVAMMKEVSEKDIESVGVDAMIASSNFNKLARIYFDAKHKRANPDQWAKNLSQLSEYDLDNLIFLSRSLLTKQQPCDTK